MIVYLQSQAYDKAVNPTWKVPRPLISPLGNILYIKPQD